MLYGSSLLLLKEHNWRNQKKEFDGKTENKVAPKRPSRNDIVTELAGLRLIIQGKVEKKQVISGFRKSHNWQKHSIFFEMLYWRTFLFRHKLDVIHIEKNVCESLLETMMNVDGKTKDSLNASLDLQVMNTKHELHPIEENGNMVLPSTCCTLSDDDRRLLCQMLSDLKVTDGYSSNLSRCVNAVQTSIS